jgi:hypothetical protein
MVWEPKYTLEPSLWIHSHGSGVTLQLRFGAVGYIFCLQLVGVIFHRDNFSLLWYHLHVYECFSAIYLIIV